MKQHHFRDQAHKDRALQDRNNGHGKAHGSWDRLAAARREVNKLAEAEWDCFDHYLARVCAYVAETNEALRFAILDNREQEIHGNSLEIPF